MAQLLNDHLFGRANFRCLAKGPFQLCEFRIGAKRANLFLMPLDAKSVCGIDRPNGFECGNPLCDVGSIPLNAFITITVIVSVTPIGVVKEPVVTICIAAIGLYQIAFH